MVDSGFPVVTPLTPSIVVQQIVIEVERQTSSWSGVDIVVVQSEKIGSKSRKGNLVSGRHASTSERPGGTNTRWEPRRLKFVAFPLRDVVVNSRSNHVRMY